jgi:hypothetical protein
LCCDGEVPIELAGDLGLGPQIWVGVGPPSMRRFTDRSFEEWALKPRSGFFTSSLQMGSCPWTKHMAAMHLEHADTRHGDGRQAWQFDPDPTLSVWELRDEQDRCQLAAMSGGECPEVAWRRQCYVPWKTLLADANRGFAGVHVSSGFASLHRGWDVESTLWLDWPSDDWEQVAVIQRDWTWT